MTARVLSRWARLPGLHVLFRWDECRPSRKWVRRTVRVKRSSELAIRDKTGFLAAATMPDGLGQMDVGQMDECRRKLSSCAKLLDGQLVGPAMVSIWSDQFVNRALAGPAP